MKTPLERIEFEAQYLQRRAQGAGLSIQLRVSSSGVAFGILDPDGGQELYCSPITSPQSSQDFCRAVDSAISTARLAQELGVSFS